MKIFITSIVLITRNFSTSNFLMSKTLGQQYGILSKLLKKPRKQTTNSKTRTPIHPKGNDLVGVDKLIPAREVRRQHVLNALLMEHVTDLMTTEEIGKDIRDRGIEILRVKVSTDFTFANIYWFANNDSTSNDLQKLLDDKSYKLRSMLIGLHVLGNVPQIVFVRDNQYSVAHKALNLLENIGIKRQEDIADQHKEIPTIYKGIQNIDVADTDTEKVHRDATSSLPPMTRDIYGLDQVYLMNKVIERSRKMKRQKTQAEKNVVKYAIKGSESAPFPATATNAKFLTLLKKKRPLNKTKKDRVRQDVYQDEDDDSTIVEEENEDFYDEEIAVVDYNNKNV